MNDLKMLDELGRTLDPQTATPPDGSGTGYSPRPPAPPAAPPESRHPGSAGGWRQSAAWPRRSPSASWPPR